MLMTRVARKAVRATEQVRFPTARKPEEHYVRLAMNTQIHDFVGSMPAGLSVVEISGKTLADAGWGSYTRLDYPEFDVCVPAPAEHLGLYDVVICQQVLEHVPEPLEALRTMRSMCRPGGTVIVSTPFLIRVHRAPVDYWRFTVDGLEHLMGKAGLTVISSGSWGNRVAVRGAFYNWPARRRWHSMTNEPDLPVVVWAFGRA